MSRHRALVALLCAVTLSLACVALAPSAGAVYVGGEPLVTAENDQVTPDTSGRWVVWTDYRKDPGDHSNGDIYAYDLSSGTEVPVCTDPADAMNPRVSGDIVVWQDYRNDTGDHSNPDIFGYDLKDMQEFKVVTEDGVQRDPDIDGTRVVWSDGRADATGDIRMIDLAGGGESVVCSASGGQRQPSISGDWVAWTDTRNSPTSDIYARNLATGAETVVCAWVGVQDYPVVDNGMVVWEDSTDAPGWPWDVCGAVLSPRAGIDTTALPVPVPIASTAATDQLPGLRNGVVVWRRRQAGADESIQRRAFYGSDVTTLCAWEGSRTAPAAGDRVAVWQDHRGSDWDLYVAKLLPALTGPVGEVTATPSNIMIDVAWKNPPDTSEVLLYSSPTRFSTHPDDHTGQTQYYRGPSEEATITGVPNGTLQYITIFRKDSEGGWSGPPPPRRHRWTSPAAHPGGSSAAVLRRSRRGPEPRDDLHRHERRARIGDHARAHTYGAGRGRLQHRAHDRRHGAAARRISSS